MLCWQTRFWLKRGESKRVIIYIINHVNINIEIFVWKIPSHAALVQHFMDHYVLQIFYKHKLFTAFDTKYYFTLKWHLSGEGGEVYRRNMRFFFGGVVMLNAPCVIRWYNESPQIFDVHANQKFWKNEGDSVLGIRRGEHGDQRAQSRESSLYHVHQLSHKTQKLKRIWKIRQL